MKKKELSKIKENLTKMKDDILKEFKAIQEDGNNYINPVGDNIDQACDSYEREILFELNDHDRARIDSINYALQKIDEGSYGICEICKKKIDKKRINTKPEVTRCMKCQSSRE